MSMLAKGITFAVFDSAAFHPITSVTVFKLSGTKWNTEKTTGHDNATPVETFAPTIRNDGDITLTITSFDPFNDTYHAILKTMSETEEERAFKITYPNSSLGSFTFNGVVTNFTYDTPVDGLFKAVITIMVNGPVTDVAPHVVTAAFTDAFHPTYVTGNVMKLTMTYDELVKVTGTPRVHLTLTSGTVQLTYASGTGTNVLNFTHTTGGGDASTSGTVSVTSPMDLNGGTIKDMAAQAATLTFTPPTTTAYTVN